MQSTEARKHPETRKPSERDRIMTSATATRRSAHAGPEPLEHSPTPLKQRIAFVSGGMGGIGTAVCRRLARQGVKVVAGCLPGYEKKSEWRSRMQSEGLPM